MPRWMIEIPQMTLQSVFSACKAKRARESKEVGEERRGEERRGEERRGEEKGKGKGKEKEGGVNLPGWIATLMRTR